MDQLLIGILGLTWKHFVMFGIGIILIYLAIAKEYEPVLLLPIGFGALLCNIPFSSAIGPDGPLTFLHNAGIVTEIFPCLIFVAIGAMCDFAPMLRNPVLMLFGAAAQFGIFATIVVAAFLGFDIKEAASIGIIGAADGPTTIYVATKVAPHLLAPLSVAAYSYMSLVPIIQPPVIKALTTKRRSLFMPVRAYNYRGWSELLSICVTLVAGIIALISVALIGMLMFGNLIKECGVVERLSKSAKRNWLIW